MAGKLLPFLALLAACTNVPESHNEVRYPAIHDVMQEQQPESMPDAQYTALNDAAQSCHSAGHESYRALEGFDGMTYPQGFERCPDILREQAAATNERNTRREREMEAARLRYLKRPLDRYLDTYGN